MRIDTRYVVSLIRAHYDGNEDEFKRVCREIADELEQANDEGSIQISHFIRGLIGDESTWIPM